jgi:hypothetical protein
MSLSQVTRTLGIADGVLLAALATAASLLPQYSSQLHVAIAVLGSLGTLLGATSKS